MAKRSRPSQDLSHKASLARETIRARIINGQWGPGQQLPAEKALAQQLRINHLTVRRALAELADEGLIVKQPRVGNFVHASVSAHIGVALILPEYLVSELFEPMTGLFSGGILGELDRSRYVMALAMYRPGRMWEDAGQVVVARGVRGVLLLSSQVSAKEIEQFREQGVHVTLLNYDPALAGSDVSWVALDTGSAIVQILGQLLEMGHRRLRIVRYADSNTWSFLRSALETFWERHGTGPLDQVLLDIPNPAGRSQWDRLDALLDVEPAQRPTAVVVPDETVALTLFRKCLQRGIRIPDDLSLAAIIDNTPHAHPVPLTAVDGSTLTPKVAAEAARLLTDAIANQNEIGARVVLPCKVHWRDSTTAPK